MSKTDKLIEWAFKTLIIGIATFALTEFKEMKASVVELNKNVAVLAAESSHQKEAIKENRREIKEIKKELLP